MQQLSCFSTSRAGTSDLLLEYIENADFAYFHYPNCADNLTVKQNTFKYLFKILVKAYYSLDLMFGRRQVRKTKGLGQGLILVPIVYDFYLHEVLKNRPFRCGNP